MFNRFEIFGFGISAALMLLAIYLVQVETNLLGGSAAETAASQNAAVVVASDAANQQQALANGLLQAANNSGSIQRLVIDDVVTGSGPEVKEGDTVTVNYIGRLQNGQEFDNSFRRGEPFTFTVGAGRVIAGWEQGVVGMQVGGERILVIPASLGYGPNGYGPIPGGATLVFAIELLEIN